MPHNRMERLDEAVTGHPAALSGLRVVAGYLGREAQESMLAAVREVIAHAPPLCPANTPERQADVGAHDQLRPARLDDR